MNEPDQIAILIQLRTDTDTCILVINYIYFKLVANLEN